MTSTNERTAPRARNGRRHMLVIAHVGLVSFLCGAVCGGIVAPFAWQLGAMAGLIVGAVVAPFAAYMAQFGALNDKWFQLTLFVPLGAGLAALAMLGPLGSAAAAGASLLFTIGLCAYLWPRRPGLDAACRACGYDLRGLPVAGGVCPECGRAAPEQAMTSEEKRCDAV